MIYHCGCIWSWQNHVLQLFEASSRVDVEGTQAVRSMALDFIIANFHTVCHQPALESLDRSLLVEIMRGRAARNTAEMHGDHWKSRRFLHIFHQFPRFLKGVQWFSAFRKCSCSALVALKRDSSWRGVADRLHPSPPHPQARK